MPCKYQKDCERRYKKNPLIWKHFYNKDGTLKYPPAKKPLFMGRARKFLDEIPKSVLAKLPHDGWDTENLITKHTIKVTGTQIFIRGQIACVSFKNIPDCCDRQLYKRLWMHNYRVKKRLERIKKEFGVEL